MSCMGAFPDAEHTHSVFVSNYQCWQTGAGGPLLKAVLHKRHKIGGHIINNGLTEPEFGKCGCPTSQNQLNSG